MTAELIELTRFCEMTYGVPPLQTRILVGALLPARYPPLWLMINAEKNVFLEDFGYVTRQLMAVDVWDTWQFRGERPRWVNHQIMARLPMRQSQPCFFADRYWQLPTPPPVLRQSRYPLLAQECVRMRHNYNPTVFTNGLMREMLLERVRAAIAAAAADRGGIVPVEPPAKWREDFIRRIRLLPLIDKYLASPTALARNLCFVGANHAALCGRRDFQELDMFAVANVMRSTVPAWMERILSVLLAAVPHAIALKAIITDTRLDDAWRNIGSKQNPLRLGEKLLIELWMSGLVDRVQQGRRWQIKPDYVVDVAKILNLQL